MWFLIVLCFSAGELALMQLIGFQFGPLYSRPLSDSALLGVYLLSRSFVSVAVATAYYRRKRD